MATFSVAIGVGNLNAGPLTPVSAIVDTGAFNSMFPAALLKGLGLEPTGREAYALADGSKVEYEVGRARIGLDGREIDCPVVFGPEDQYLLGATALGFFRVLVDPEDRQLWRKPLYGQPLYLRPIS